MQSRKTPVCQDDVMVSYIISYRQIGFIEEIQRIYNKQKGAGDYAKDNVNTIIFGYGKTGI